MNQRSNQGARSTFGLSLLTAHKSSYCPKRRRAPRSLAHFVADLAALVRNAMQHGVENEDGTYSSWVDRPQGGGPRSGPVLPARETIKQPIASIDGGWLAERRALLLQEQQEQGGR